MDQPRNMCSSFCGRGMVSGFPQSQMLEDLFHKLLLFDKRYYFHRSQALRTKQGIDVKFTSSWGFYVLGKDHTKKPGASNYRCIRCSWPIIEDLKIYKTVGCLIIRISIAFSSDVRATVFMLNVLNGGRRLLLYRLFSPVFSIFGGFKQSNLCKPGTRSRFH